MVISTFTMNLNYTEVKWSKYWVKKNTIGDLLSKKSFSVKSKQKMNYVIVYIGVSTKDPLLLNKRSVYTIRPTYTLYVHGLEIFVLFFGQVDRVPKPHLYYVSMDKPIIINLFKTYILFFFHIIINLITLIKINKIIMKKI